MKFAEIRDRIVNNPGFRTLAEVREAGYRVVRERDGDRYFLARPEDLTPLLVRLGDIAEVRRGFTTGANDFFYLEPVGRTVAEVAELARQDPRAPVRIRNGAGWEGEIEAVFLRPLLFSLKETRSVRPELCRLRRCAFVCRKPLELLRQRYKHVQTYIEAYASHRVQLKHGGECLLPEVPSLRGRSPWYSLPEQPGADFIANRFLGERFLFLEGGDFFVCDVFFIGYLHKGDDRTIITAELNSSLTAVIADVLARKTYGIGVAYLYGPEVSDLTIVNPVAIKVAHRNRLQSAFDRLAEREVKSIFEELGFSLCRERRCPHPEHPYEYVDPAAFDRPGSLAQVLPDRRALDEVVFEILGLTEEEQRQVYKAVAQLVKERLVKARSV